MTIIKIYIWLTKLPLKESLPLILMVGLAVAIILPSLSRGMQDWIINFIEEHWLD